MSSYFTAFTGTENPLSESSNWDSAFDAGNIGGLGQYNNLRKTPGFCFGTEDPNAGVAFNDSTELVTGLTWGTNQTVIATVVINASAVGKELELILNGAITDGTPGDVRWYEFDFTITGEINIFLIIPATSTFTNLSGQQNLPGGALVTGNRLKAINSNGTLTAYVDVGSGFVQVATATDSTLTGGSPGLGTFLSQGHSYTVSNNNDMGFSDFSASDASGLTIEYVAPANELAGGGNKMIGRKYV